MRVKYKQWAVDYIDEFKVHQFDLIKEDKDNLSSFIRSKKTFIEIGPGKGDFIISLAKNHLDYNFIVIELNKTVAGICLKKIDESKLENIRLVAGDFYRFVEQIEPNSIEGIFLNFSDPWPKARHENRRLTSDKFLTNYAYILKDDSYIFQKTDNINFFRYSLDQYEKNNWEIVFRSLEYNMEDDFDAETEFEFKFKKQGIKINRVIVKKNQKTKIKSEE